MREVIRSFKAELKVLASTIRSTRTQFKEAQRAGTDIWKLSSALSTAQYEFRHKHIAYCLLRGRTRDEIEQPRKRCEKKCYCCNKPNEDYILKLVGGAHEIIRSRSLGSIQESASGSSGSRSSEVVPVQSTVAVERDAGVLAITEPRKSPELVNRLTQYLGRLGIL